MIHFQSLAVTHMSMQGRGIAGTWSQLKELKSRLPNDSSAKLIELPLLSPE
jgi:hypothetical protein